MVDRKQVPGAGKQVPGEELPSLSLSTAALRRKAVPRTSTLRGLQRSQSSLGIAGFVRAVLPYFAKLKLQAAIIMACLLVELAGKLVVPILFKLVIDRAIVPHDVGMLVGLLVVLAALAVLGTVAAIVEDVTYARIGVAVMNAIRYRMFEHLQKLSMGFYARTPGGDIGARFSTDLAAVENALLWNLPALISGVLGFAIGVVILFTLDWRLAAIATIGLAIAFRISSKLEQRASALNYDLKAELADVAVVVQENVAAQAVVKGYSLQHQALDQFRARLSLLKRVAARANWTSYIMERIPSAAALLLGFVTLGVGAYFVFHDWMTVGELVAFNALFRNVSSSVNDITFSIPTLLEGAAGMQRVKELLDEKPAVRDGKDLTPVPPLHKAIELARVTFGYTPKVTNLDEVSLVIPKHASVAFVGASGSGKSTILSLVSRFYDPRNGVVRFDGRDVRDFPVDAIRAQLGIVFQESILFDTTIRDNIRMGRLDATEADIVAAAKQAEIHDVVMSLPDKYDTVVGERGGRLSGGQRQRIAIARALVRDPAILILDEATSALDPQTEAAINETLRVQAQNRTVLSVTHRLASVVHCHRVFVLDRGKIVEHGAPDDLLAAGGPYRKLWDKQHGIEVSADGVSAEITAERLRAIPLFAHLDRSTLDDIAGKMESAQNEPGFVLIREGDTGDRFYVIARGKVEVMKRAGDGHPERVDILDDGDHFGEIALLNDVPRTATVRALTTVTYLTLKRDHFLKLVAKVPGLREQLGELVRERLDENAAVVRGAPGVV